MNLISVGVTWIFANKAQNAVILLFTRPVSQPSVHAQGVFHKLNVTLRM